MPNLEPWPWPTEPNDEDHQRLSMAISLKRIADTLDAIARRPDELARLKARLDRVAQGGEP